MPIELGKNYTTRDGRKVRILCVDRKHDDYPIAAAVEEDEQEYIEAYTIDGRYREQGDISDWDLIEVKPRIKHKVTIALLFDKRTKSVFHFTGPTANISPCYNVIATKEVEFDVEEPS